MVTDRLGWTVATHDIYRTTDGSHWVKQYSTPTSLGGVDFINSTSGWAVGFAHLYGTTDGSSWNQLGEPDSPLRSVHFVSPLLGWGVAGGADVQLVHGRFVPASGGVLVRSSNGGHDWSPRPGPLDAQTVCFSDGSQGWVGTSGGGVWRTTDGGGSWTKVLQRPGVEPSLRQSTIIECAAPHALWVLFQGGGAAAGHLPYIAYATVDGSHWRAVLEETMTEQRVAPGVPEGPDSYPGSFSVVDPSDAVFVGDGPATNQAPVVLASQGGAVLTRPGAISDSAETSDAAFLSSSTGWVLARISSTGLWTIQATHDGGSHWTEQFAAP